MTQKVQGFMGLADSSGNELSLAGGVLPVSLPASQNAGVKTKKSVSGSFGTDVDALIAAVTGKRIKITAFNFFTFGTSASTIILKSGGTSGTELWRVCLQSIASNVMGAAMATPAPDFFFGTVAGERLTADTNTTDTVHYSISYYDDDAT